MIAQNATAAAAAGVNYAGSTGSLTIADLSHVWVVCDVYENDLASVHLGEQAEIRLAAYPGKVLTGTIGDIGAIPEGILRLGMFTTATFQSAKETPVVAVPSDAVLHLRDRAFVFEPVDAAGHYRTATVATGPGVPGGGNLIEITSGLRPGQQVVANALELQNTAAQ